MVQNSEKLDEESKQKLPQIRKELLMMYEPKEQLALMCNGLSSMWDWEWKHSNKYQHLADACNLVLKEYKEYEKLNPKAKPKSKPKPKAKAPKQQNKRT